MNTIPRDSKYLLCTCQVSDGIIKTVKQKFKQSTSAKHKEQAWYDFMDWQRKPNELVVLTMYAYDDIGLPAFFDTIFEADNCRNFVQVNMLIHKVILNDWAPGNQIVKGHKHICVIEFENAIPELIKTLPIYNNENVIPAGVEFGLCVSEDFDLIQKTKNNRPDH